MPHKPAGQFRCPTCLTRRDFVVVAGGENARGSSPIQCIICGYEYSDVQIYVDGVPQRTPVISVERLQRAQRAYIREFQSNQIRAGAPRESFDPRRRRA